MDVWTCPKCQRNFGKKRQSHLCSPGLSLEEYFDGAAPWEEPIFTVVRDHIATLGPVIVDPLNMGIKFKNGPMFLELRAMKKWVALGFSLGNRLASDRLSRKVIDYNNKFFHVINVDDPAMIDEEILGWITRSYHFVGGGSNDRPASDPMVPDDVEDDFFDG